MGLEREPFQYIVGTTREFILQAKQEGVFRKVIDLPDLLIREKGGKKPSIRSWVDRVNMFVVRVSTAATLEDLSEIYSRLIPSKKRLSGEAIRLYINDTLKTVWENCSDETREKYPFESLSLKKRASLTTTLKYSRAGIGIVVGVYDRLQEGATVDQLYDEFSTVQLGSARSRLKEMGVEVPTLQMTPEQTAQLREKLKNPDLTQEQLLELYKQMGYSQIRQFLAGDDPVLKTLADISKFAGLHVQIAKLHLVRSAIARSGLKMAVFTTQLTKPYKGLRELKYYVIASTQLPKALKVLAEASELNPFRQNPLIQIAGNPVEKIPTTTQLWGRKGYKSVGNLLESEGYKIGGRGLTIPKILGDANDLPPIFQLRSRQAYFYSDSSEEQLKEAIRRIKE